MLLTGPFAMLSMPSFDFHLPPCTEGLLIHLSPLWQLPLWQLPLFPSVAQFPSVLGRSSIWDLKFTFSEMRFLSYDHLTANGSAQYLDHLELIGIAFIQVILNYFGSVDTYAKPLDIINGSQLAKMKKSIPDMSLP